jgi:hypothetical protein
MSKVDELGQKLKEWGLRLGHDDIHSIGKQIAHMLSRSAFYRAINQSRKFLPDDEDTKKKANGMLHELVDEGYFSLQAIGIRRLLDKSAISGPRGVFSLVGLITDIEDNAHLLTHARTCSKSAGSIKTSKQPKTKPVRTRCRNEDARARGLRLSRARDS